MFIKERKQMEDRTTVRIGRVYDLLEKIKQDRYNYDPWVLQYWSYVFRKLQGVHIEEREEIVDKTREYMN